MKRRLLDILACPIDKSYPLDLLELISEDDVIREGILFCGRCGRYYPISDEIPIMRPDELRDDKEDVAFLEKWAKKLPDNILYEGKPFSLRRS